MTPEDFHKRRQAAKTRRELSAAQKAVEPFEVYRTGGFMTPLAFAKQNGVPDELEPFEREIIDGLTKPCPQPVSGLDVLDQRATCFTTNTDVQNLNCWARAMFKSPDDLPARYRAMYEDPERHLAFYSQALGQPFDGCDVLSTDDRVFYDVFKPRKTREKQITYDPSKWTGRKA